MSATVTVPVRGDRLVERNETLRLSLSGVTNAVIGTAASLRGCGCGCGSLGWRVRTTLAAASTYSVRISAGAPVARDTSDRTFTIHG